MSEHPLPTFWTEEDDAKGSRFYSNHITRTTQWERPVPNDPPIQRPKLPYINKTNGSEKTAECKCTPRVMFWIAAATVMPAWIFSVTAVAGESWLDEVSLSTVDEDIIGKCSDDDLRAATNDFCDLYASFMVMQLVATLLASVVLVLVAVAFFCPASGWRCSTKMFGGGGACVLAASSFFQLMALVLIICIERAESDTAPVFNTFNTDYDLGGTFWVAVVGFIFAIFDGGILFAFVSSAGDGLFDRCNSGDIASTCAYL